MDQAKNVIAILMKHMFWVLCGIVVIIAFLTWYMATSALQAETKTNGDKISGAETKIVGVNNQGRDTGTGRKPHPDNKTFEGTKVIIQDRQKDVYTVWKRQYEKQLGILVWPDKGLSQGFRDAVNDLRPIEVIQFNPNQTPHTPLDQEVKVDFRETYRDFIKGHLPSLATRVRAKWNIKGSVGEASGGGAEGGLGGGFGAGGGGDPAAGGEAAGAGGEGSGGDEEEDSNIIVDWNQADQARIVNRLTVFPHRDNVPTTLQMLYVQEDLWVYSSLLDIIDKTNGPPGTPRHKAKIKRIDHLLIGADVRGPLGTVQRVQSADGGNVGQGNQAMQENAPANAANGGAQGGKETVKDPADGRYVGKDLQPVTGAVLRSAYDSKSADSVAKRLQVRIGLKMDTREITNLLLECRKSPLPIEVRQVRINRHSAKAPQQGFGGIGGGNTAVQKSVFEQPVEIYGVILMYNKPDEGLKGDPPAAPNANQANVGEPTGNNS